jgi:hypothetical protein
MTLLGIGLFVLIFMMLTPASRAMLEHSITGTGEWLAKYAPFSYLVLAIVLIVPIVATVVVMSKPEPPEPEDPLARYKDGADVVED